MDPEFIKLKWGKPTLSVFVLLFNNKSGFVLFYKKEPEWELEDWPDGRESWEGMSHLFFLCLCPAHPHHHRYFLPKS